MMIKLMLALIVGVGISSSTSVWSQKKSAQTTKTKTSSKTSKSINSLKNEQEKVQKNLKRAQDSLKNTQLSTKKAMREVSRLDQGIEERSRLIQNKNVEIQTLQENISSLEKDILRLELEYASNKEKYVDLIYHAYVKNSSYSKLMFVLSAESFSQAYRRFRYIQDFASMRKSRADEIGKNRDDLVAKRSQLTEQKAQSTLLVQEREAENQKLIEEKDEQNRLLVSLKNKEKEFAAELAKQQAAAEKLDQKIKELIEKEAEEAAKRMAKKNDEKAKNQVKTENKAFEGSKGTLPSPLPGSHITGRFGIQFHPVLRHVKTNNKGVYCTSEAGAVAKAVYEGEVTQLFSVPGSNTAVIVRHGNYLSVYSNLTKIFVRKGQKVMAGDRIGSVYEDENDDNKTTLFFQIWKEKELQNPEEWIKGWKRKQ
ncbi:MAG: peptidoglycan DD-metalloendopeptidase family protein [Paludibacteraceae bacterium]|nr:peptidoglycan DD-metalloendopeptidase family protein [Paludibacteraceae bacterium]